MTSKICLFIVVSYLNPNIKIITLFLIYCKQSDILNISDNTYKENLADRRSIYCGFDIFWLKWSLL